MKKNGFTLIELMAVIVILALLALMITPNVLSSISKYNKRIYETQLNNILSAAEHWAADTIEDRGCLICVADSEYKVSGKNCATQGGEGCTEAPTGTTASTSVTLKELQDGGYIKENLKNTQSKGDFASCLTVSITKNSKNGEFIYTIVDPDILESSCTK
jgi:prepilin-type N-terminal cleavage/methylation domain-containing protein